MTEATETTPRPPRRRLRTTAFVVVADALLWAAALAIANLVRRGFDWSLVDTRGLTTITLLAIAVQLIYGLLTGLYRGRYRFVSFEESGVYAAGTVLNTVVLLVVTQATADKHLVPISAVLAAAAYQLVGAFGVRYALRAVAEIRRVSRHERVHQALIYGAGEGGVQVARTLREDGESEYGPVAFLDDDPGKARLQIFGLPVAGGLGDLAAAASRFHADTVIVAMPSASPSNVARVSRVAQEAGLAVRILPRVSRLLNGEIRVGPIRELRLADLLGRGEVKTDLESISGYLKDRVVLVTGAGGSIGSELCKAVGRYEPARLLMLDHDESAIHTLQLALEGRALLDNPDLILADIRDSDAILDVMNQHRPDVVFHAAAHKHVTLLERYPEEAYKTNVAGTATVLEAAVATGVSRFVNVSTDKAADPSSVLGVSKRLAEMLTSGVAKSTGRDYMSVRFGNVLGSRGSVIPALTAQIDAGGPITITHPNVTRYFMTTEEAVQLVVQAGAIGRAGEVLVLDMGEPVRVVDMARELIALHAPGRDIEIVFTGLRPGEKLHEVLSFAGETPVAQPHELITSFTVPPLALADLDDAAIGDADKIKLWMWERAGVPPPDRPRR